MAVAISLQQYLDKCGIEYEVMRHSPTSTSKGTARAIHMPAEAVAKSVILEDEKGYLMAVIPASHFIELGRISRQMDRRLGLATESELTDLFADCEPGAIPPVGQAYHMEVVIEDDLYACPDVYFEAGDHSDVVHVSGSDFRRMTGSAGHGHFSSRL